MLGSLPGEASLAAGRYYAHPRNQFWQLVGAVIGRDLVALDYELRLQALLNAGIGLWDTVQSAHREGSLDSAIREESHNSLHDLCAQLPALRAIGFNGAKSARIGSKLLAGSPYMLVSLPSSSPAYAAMNLAGKQARWMELGQFLK
ncbi:hypothetical protein GCM10009127_28980 [Alteraurantiacibacter aestuarii]